MRKRSQFLLFHSGFPDKSEDLVNERPVAAPDSNLQYIFPSCRYMQFGQSSLGGFQNSIYNIIIVPPVTDIVQRKEGFMGVSRKFVLEYYYLPENIVL